MVTHPSIINQAQHRATSLFETNALSLSHTTTYLVISVIFVGLFFTFVNNWHIVADDSTVPQMNRLTVVTLSGCVSVTAVPWKGQTSCLMFTGCRLNKSKLCDMLRECVPQVTLPLTFVLCAHLTVQSLSFPAFCQRTCRIVTSALWFPGISDSLLESEMSKNITGLDFTRGQKWWGEIWKDPHEQWSLEVTF